MPTSILPSKHMQPETASSLQRTAAPATSLRGGTAAARAPPPLRRGLDPLGTLRGVEVGCGPHQRPCPHGDHGCCCSLDVAQQQVLLCRCPYCLDAMMLASKTILPHLMCDTQARRTTTMGGEGSRRFLCRGKRVLLWSPSLTLPLFS